MKVTHVIPTLSAKDGGPAEALKRLVPALHEHGVVCSVVTTDKGGVEQSNGTLGARIVKAYPPSNLTFAPALISAVWRATDGADVVHAHGYPNFPSSVALQVAARRGIPVLLQPHGALDEYQWRSGLRRKTTYATLVDRGMAWKPALPVLVSSALEADGVRRVLPGAAVHLCPLGVDDALLGIGDGRQERATHPLKSHCHVVFLGRIAKKKRLDVLLDALNRLGSTAAGENISVTIAGPIDPGLGYDPEHLAARLPESMNVRLIGHVDQQGRKRLLADADVFVLPSEDESFGIAAAEAMAAGCVAVLTPEVGLAPEAAAAGACVLTTREPARLADVLRELMLDPRRRAEISVRAVQYARRNYTWTRVAVQLSEIYANIASAGAGLREGR